METIDRYRGAMLGLAVGDALGTTLEFKRPGSFERHTEITGGGPFGLRAGEWTDDTSMALCLAESLVETGGFDPVDQLRRYTRWYEQGHLSVNGKCFDIGNTVLDALRRFEQTGEPYCGSEDFWMAGNGSLMRLAPVPLFHAGDPVAAIERSGESSRTTHQAAAAVDACRYYGGLIASAIAGASKDNLLSARHAPVAGYWDEHALAAEIDEIAAGSFKHRQPPDIKGVGFVVKSLEAALWAFHNTDSFRDGAIAAVNLGDDADTTGAIYGQLAGAHYGVDGIPAEWLATLAKRDLIEDFADGLYRSASQT
jgi:ADP-ribosyl-[dinitrogen reductase] hydrolase